MNVVRGNVVRNKETKRKEVIFKPELEVSDDEFEFVCDRPHQDMDFSYVCWREWCRCITS